MEEEEGDTWIVPAAAYSIDEAKAHCLPEEEEAHHLTAPEVLTVYADGRIQSDKGACGLRVETLLDYARRLRPGYLSPELRAALGVGPGQLPDIIPRMWVHGYPPSYLRRVTGPGAEGGHTHTEDTVLYAGFNAPPPPGTMVVDSNNPYSMHFDVRADRPPEVRDRAARVRMQMWMERMAAAAQPPPMHQPQQGVKRPHTDGSGEVSTRPPSAPPSPQPPLKFMRPDASPRLPMPPSPRAFSPADETTPMHAPGSLTSLLRSPSARSARLSSHPQNEEGPTSSHLAPPSPTHHGGGSSPRLAPIGPKPRDEHVQPSFVVVESPPGSPHAFSMEGGLVDLGSPCLPPSSPPFHPPPLPSSVEPIHPHPSTVMKTGKPSTQFSPAPPKPPVVRSSTPPPPEPTEETATISRPLTPQPPKSPLPAPPSPNQQRPTSPLPPPPPKSPQLLPESTPQPQPTSMPPPPPSSPRPEQPTNQQQIPPPSPKTTVIEVVRKRKRPSVDTNDTGVEIMDVETVLETPKSTKRGRSGKSRRWDIQGEETPDVKVRIKMEPGTADDLPADVTTPSRADVPDGAHEENDRMVDDGPQTDKISQTAEGVEPVQAESTDRQPEDTEMGTDKADSSKETAVGEGGKQPETHTANVTSEVGTNSQSVDQSDTTAGEKQQQQEGSAGGTAAAQQNAGAGVAGEQPMQQVREAGAGAVSQVAPAPTSGTQAQGTGYGQYGNMYWDSTTNTWRQYPAHSAHTTAHSAADYSQWYANAQYSAQSYSANPYAAQSYAAGAYGAQPYGASPYYGGQYGTYPYSGAYSSQAYTTPATSAQYEQYNYNYYAQAQTAQAAQPNRDTTPIRQHSPPREQATQPTAPSASSPDKANPPENAKTDEGRVELEPNLFIHPSRLKLLYGNNPPPTVRPAATTSAPAPTAATTTAAPSTHGAVDEHRQTEQTHQTPAEYDPHHSGYHQHAPPATHQSQPSHESAMQQQQPDTRQGTGEHAHGETTQEGAVQQTREPEGQGEGVEEEAKEKAATLKWDDYKSWYREQYGGESLTEHAMQHAQELWVAQQRAREEQEAAAALAAARAREWQRKFQPPPDEPTHLGWPWNVRAPRPQTAVVPVYYATVPTAAATAAGYYYQNAYQAAMVAAAVAAARPAAAGVVTTMVVKEPLKEKESAEVLMQRAKEYALRKQQEEEEAARRKAEEEERRKREEEERERRRMEGGGVEEKEKEGNEEGGVNEVQTETTGTERGRDKEKEQEQEKEKEKETEAEMEADKLILESAVRGEEGYDRALSLPAGNSGQGENEEEEEGGSKEGEEKGKGKGTEEEKEAEQVGGGEQTGGSSTYYGVWDEARGQEQNGAAADSNSEYWQAYAAYYYGTQSAAATTTQTEPAKPPTPPPKPKTIVPLWRQKRASVGKIKAKEESSEGEQTTPSKA